MESTIRIQMMGNFMIFFDEQRSDQLASRTKKSTALIQYLMAHRNESVSISRLLTVLWDDEKSRNPENALKTMISRLRVQLNEIYPGLGGCIVADRGAYHWENLPNMQIDLYELENLFDSLKDTNLSKTELEEIYSRIVDLYVGDLLAHCEQSDWIIARSADLHAQYLNTVYAYVELLKEQNEHEKIIKLCRTALDIDQFDDRVHMELMTALIKTERVSEALSQYKHVTDINYRYLGVQPSAEMQAFYKSIVRAGKTLDYSMDSIRRELSENDKKQGAFVCEYVVFKDIFNLQMRNLERLGTSMFLCVVMVGNPDEPMESMRFEKIMSTLLEIMQQNLRKGDTITRFSPSIFALLLPMVNYTTGTMVMERIKRLFYLRYPNSNIPYNYNVGPLSSHMEKKTDII